MDSAVLNAIYKFITTAVLILDPALCNLLPKTHLENFRQYLYSVIIIFFYVSRHYPSYQYYAELQARNCMINSIKRFCIAQQ